MIALSLNAHLSDLCRTLAWSMATTCFDVMVNKAFWRTCYIKKPLSCENEKLFRSFSKKKQLFSGFKSEKHNFINIHQPFEFHIIEFCFVLRTSKYKTTRVVSYFYVSSICGILILTKTVGTFITVGNFFNQLLVYSQNNLSTLSNFLNELQFIPKQSN